MRDDPLSFEDDITVFTKALLHKANPRHITFSRDLGEVAMEAEIANICERLMQKLKGTGTDITSDIPDF